MTKLYEWQQRQYKCLNAEDIAAIVEACRIAHSNFISIGLACGIRAAFRCLEELQVERDKHGFEKACIKANSCAALAFTVVCCLSPYKEQVDFTLYSPSDWIAALYSMDKKVEIKMLTRSFASVEEVFEAEDAQLFESVCVSDI